MALRIVCLMLSLIFFPGGRSLVLGRMGGTTRFWGISTSLLLNAKQSGTADARQSSTTSPVNKMPITVISGFLGAGKTSYLQHIIKGETGKKYGLVVNDMSAVNVDSKLIRKQTLGQFDGIDAMELQNGCVCCTLAEDLMASVSRLVELSDAKGVNYDHIVVECSGIAEPRKIRELFQEADDFASPLTARVSLDTLITLVDATIFLSMYGSTDADLCSNAGLAVSPLDTEGVRAMNDAGTGQRRVTDLLLEQVECADVIIINKCDLLANPLDVGLVKRVISSINPTARVYTSVRGMLQDGRVQGEALLGSAKAEGAASWGILDEHRKMVEAVQEQSKGKAVSKAVECAPDCKDPTHSHDHSHGHEHATAAACAPDCSDPTHNHDHSHNLATHSTASAPECNDPTHNHDHGHNYAAPSAACAPECNDPTHNHDHSHSHSHSQTTAEDRFGITSFVYQRRRPFHPARLSLFLQSLGTLSVTGISEMTAALEASEKVGGMGDGSINGAGSEEVLVAARRALLRSKGFVWMGTSSAAAYFMSHAGQFLGNCFFCEAFPLFSYVLAVYNSQSWWC